MSYDPKNEDIVIHKLGNDYNRFQVALDIQNACNPAGVARELVKIILDAQNDPASTGTMWVRKDPAVRLVIDKLLDLSGRPGFSDIMDDFETCEHRAKALAE